MKKAILATKVGMTQVFDEVGNLIPVTVLQAGPMYVLQTKTEEKDGYKAVVVGYADIREKLVNTGDVDVMVSVSGQRGRVCRQGRDQSRHLQARRQGRRYRGLQGQGLPGRHQALRPAQRTHGAWFQVPSSSGLERLFGYAQPRTEG